MPHITNTEVILPHALSAEARRQLIDSLYAVHRRIFDGVGRESFARYVVESKAEYTWLLVHKNEEGEAVGYFALHIFEKQLGGEPLAVFRAEAGLLREYRGGNVNARFWMERVVRYVLEHPGRRVFYMGSLVHPSSYWLFARHCGEVWPRRDQETPPELLAFMDTLATEFGLEKVHPARPLVRRVGWRTRETDVERDYWAHCEKPEVRFFLEANPGYGEGHGLVTVVPITLENLLSTARSLLERRVRQPLERLAALAQRTRVGARLGASQVVQQPRRVPRELHALEAGTRLFVLSGPVELEHDGLVMTQRGSTSLEARRPLRLKAREREDSPVRLAA